MIVCENDIQARTLKDINTFIKEKDLKFNTELEFLGCLYKATEEKRLSEMYDNFDHNRLMEIITDRKHGNKAEYIADYILAESRSLLATIKLITALKTLLNRYKELENE